MTAPPLRAVDALALQAEALFVYDAGGRTTAENSQDRPAPPRLYLAVAADGVIVRLSTDVPASSARLIVDLAATSAFGRPPAAQPFVAILARDAPVEHVESGFVWSLALPVTGRDPSLVISGTAAGAALLHTFPSEGVPAGLYRLGFDTLDEFWEPWCIAFDGAEAAAIAFAARLGERAADVGVATVPEFRGRGHAATTVAGWAAHPNLAGRRLFYSTSTANRSSQRVVERLGLPLLGHTLRIT